MKDRIEALAREVLGDLAHVGVAVAQGGARVAGLASAPGLPPMTGHQVFRVASVSKIGVGRIAWQACDGDLEREVSALLGFDLRPDRKPVTLAQVLAHSSGLSDAGGYALDPRLPLEAAMQGAVWTSDPGARFDYCNLGYIVAAAAIERLTGQSFGALSAQHGFFHNWVGTDRARRDLALPIHRRGPDGFVPQIDATVGTAEIERGDGTGLALSDVRNPSAFSPQGGARMSLDEMLTLAQDIGDDAHQPLWSPGPPEPSDLWDQYGAGLMILRRPSFYPRPLIGHFANAYGLAGGVWHDPDAGLSFAYALNGLPVGDEDDALRPAERRIFEVVSHLAP